MKKYFLFALLPFIFFSCSDGSLTQPGDRIPAASLEGTLWKLTFLVENRQIMFPPDDVGYTIQFTDTTNQVTGAIACNQFSGSYQVDDPNSLRIEDLATTLALCTDDPLSGFYMNILGIAKTYQIEGNSLSIKQEVGDNALVFEAVETE